MDIQLYVDSTPRINIESYVNIKELERLVDSLELTHGENIEYQGLSFLLMTCDKNEGKPGMWSQNTEGGFDYDVYIWENLSPDFKRGIVFHEVLECTLHDQREKLFPKSEDPCYEAHKLTRPHELNYVQKFMDHKQFSEYKAFIEQFKGK